MSGGLREYWGLPANEPDTNGNGEFGKNFRAGLETVNQDLQVIAVRGDQAEHQRQDANRQTLIKAYQNVAPLGDTAKNSQVIGAVAKVKQQTSAKATSLNAGYEEWQKRQPAFDEALVKIGQLEDAGDAKSPAFRKVSDAIQGRVDNRDYVQATAAFDQMQPKLDAVIPQSAVQAGTGDGGDKVVSPVNTNVVGSDSTGNFVAGESGFDISSTKTNAEPSEPPKKPSLGGTNEEKSQPPLPPQKKPGDMSKSEIDAENRAVQGRRPADFKPSPGDGKSFSMDHVFKEMKNKNPMVTVSSTDQHHRRIWNEWLGKKGEPPLVFQAGGRIRVNVEKLSQTDRQKFIELDKLRNPSDYPTAKKPPTGSKAPVDPKKKPSVDPMGTTPPVGNPKPPTSFKPSPGDGKAFSMDQVFGEMKKKNQLVTVSSSNDHHRRIWHEWLGKDPKSEPPVAFQAGGRIRVNVEKLSPSDRQKFIELDKALNPSAYPPPKKPPTGSNNKGGKGGGGSGGGGGGSGGSGGGGGKPTPHPSAKTSGKVSNLERAGKAFEKGFKAYQTATAIPALQGLMMIAGVLVQGFEALADALSALKGGGFIFKEQVSQAQNLGSKTAALVTGYNNAGYHKSLDDIFKQAKEIDKEDPDGQYGTDALSIFCAGIEIDVIKHRDECQNVQTTMQNISTKAVYGRTYSENLLKNKEFMAAAAYYKWDLRVLQAHLDFDKILRALNIDYMNEHLKEVNDDLKRIQDNIWNNRIGHLEEG